MNTISKITFILLLIILCVQIHAKDNKNINQVAFNEAVNDGIRKYIPKIPPGKEIDFGFFSTNEFAKIKIGKAYQICAISEDSFSEKCSTDTFILVQRWKVPIIIDNEFRCFIDIVEKDDIYTAVGFGLNKLAIDVGLFENQNPVFKDKEKYLFIDNSLSAYCFATKNESFDFEFFPFREFKCSESIEKKKSYTSKELYKILKTKHDKLNDNDY